MDVYISINDVVCEVVLGTQFHYVARLCCKVTYYTSTIKPRAKVLIISIAGL